jgi:hypothetical protein
MTNQKQAAVPLREDTNRARLRGDTNRARLL